jgi:hypothetical protein
MGEEKGEAPLPGNEPVEVKTVLGLGPRRNGASRPPRPVREMTG